MRALALAVVTSCLSALLRMMRHGLSGLSVDLLGLSGLSLGLRLSCSLCDLILVGNVLSERGFWSRFVLTFGVVDDDNIGEWFLGTNFALRVPGQHYFYFDAEHSLLEENVTNSRIDVFINGCTGFDHITITEFHGFRTSTAQFTADRYFTPFGTVFHYETDNTIAGTTHGQTAEQFVAQRLSLGNGAHRTVRDTLSIEFDVALREVETFLDERRQFTNATAFITQNVLRTRRTNNDFRTNGRHTHFTARIPVFSQLAHEKFIDFGEEHTVRNKLALL